MMNNKINLIKPVSPTPRSLENSLVDYEQHGKPLFAIIRKDLGNKLLLENEDGESLNLPLNRLYVYKEKLENISVQSLKSFANSVKDSASKIKLEEIWRAVISETAPITFAKFQQSFAQKDNILSEASLRVSLLLDKTYFKRTEQGFLPKTEDDVKESKKVVVENLKKESERLALQLTIKKILRGDRKVQLPPAIEDLELIAAIGRKSEFAKNYSNLLDNICSEEKLCDHRAPIEEKAFALLVKIGHFSNDTNLAPFRLGRPVNFSTEERESAEKLFQEFKNKIFDNRLDLTDLETFTVDSDSTQDFDDAISYHLLDSNHVISVHITDVSETLTENSILENTARRRGTSIYCPDQTYPMLPSTLSEGVLSLKENSKRPALTFSVVLDKDLNFLERKVDRSLISVTKRLSYDVVDQWLSDASVLENHNAIKNLWSIVQHLEKRRINSGSTIFQRRDLAPELDKNNKVKLVSNSDDTPARKLISELMILANETAATFAKDNSIPFLYRTQADPESDIETAVAHIPDGPAREYARRSKLKRSDVQTNPESHFSLGLNAYCQATSPIRRYLDLVLIRQLNHFIATGKPLYSVEQITKIKEDISPSLDEANIIQRERNRFWLLKYIEQLKIKTIYGTVVKVESSRPLVELESLTSIFLFQPLKRGEDQAKLQLGDRILLEITKLQPHKDKLHLKEIS